MIKDNSASGMILQLFLGLICILVVIVIMVPVLNVFAISFSSYEAYLNGKVIIWPVDWTLTAYQKIFKEGTVLNGLKNSFVYMFVGTAVNMFLTILTAYPLAQKELPLRRVYSLLFVFTMFFGGGMIPDYLLVTRLKMYNTIWALIIPSAISTYYLLIMRSFFASVPSDLKEAAIVDGANDFTILVRIILPLSKASIAAIGLFYAVSHWNSWFSSMIYLKNSFKYPLQLVLRNIILSTQYQLQSDQLIDTTLTSVQYATLFISMIPMLLIYPFVQKYFVKGVLVGSIKG